MKALLAIMLYFGILLMESVVYYFLVFAIVGAQSKSPDYALH